MYDELVKRLREAFYDWPDADLHYEAANAIEELESRFELRSMKKTITLPCWIGDKIRDRVADYIFTILSVKFLENGKIWFVCGNQGTDDYMSFCLDDLERDYELV